MDITQDVIPLFSYIPLHFTSGCRRAQKRTCGRKGGGWGTRVCPWTDESDSQTKPLRPKCKA